MLDILCLQKQLISPHIKPALTAVDFTMGNGHDTEYLCGIAGDDGFVYAFDIQESALKNTAERLEHCGYSGRYRLILDSHSNASAYISGGFDIGMFNLGWLPGSEDKTVHTNRSTTLPAVDFAVNNLRADGILIIAVYPGHEEGRLEGEAIQEYLSGLDRHVFCSSKFRIVNSPSSPYFFCVEKK